MTLFRTNAALRAPVFAQLLALVLVSLIAALAINVAIVIMLPPPPPEMFPLSEVATALKAGGEAVHASNDRTFTAHVKPTPPPFVRGRPGYRESILMRTLADDLNAPVSKVRLALLNRP